MPRVGSQVHKESGSPDLQSLLGDGSLLFPFDEPAQDHPHHAHVGPKPADAACAVSGAQGCDPFNPLALAGDELTWNMEDWSWDPQMLAASRRAAHDHQHPGPATHPSHAPSHSSACPVPCSFTMPGMLHDDALASLAAKHTGAPDAAVGGGVHPSPFTAHSAADLGIQPSAAGRTSDEHGSAGGCCGEPSAKRAKASSAPADADATIEAALANGAVVLSSKPAARDADHLVCQVSACGKDLSSLKDYHQRYRVCETHIRLQAVVKDGRLQRFCQQCGRFHPLAAFDGARKSCREQLNKHNARRRRRAQIEALKAKAPAGASQAMEAAMASAPSLPTNGVPATVGGAALQAIAATTGAAATAAAAAAASAGGPPPPDGPPVAADAPAPGSSDVQRLLSGLMQSPLQLQALRLLLGVHSNAALPALQPFEPFDCPVCDPAKAACGPAPPADSAVSNSTSNTPAEPASYVLASNISQGRGEYAPQYQGEHRTLRISMKLFNRTPADLPPDLRDQITSWLSSAPAQMEGYIRPGCVHLTLHMLVTEDVHHAAASAGVQGLVAHLLHATRCAFWLAGSFAVQLFEQVAVVTDGQLQLVTSFDEASTSAGLAASAPSVPSPTQLCVVAGGAAGTRIHWSDGQHHPHTQREHHAALSLAEDMQLHMRFHGAQSRLQLQLLPGGSPGTAMAVAPCLHGCGVAMLECSKGAYAWPARPLLVVDDPAIAAEVQQLSCCANRPKDGLPPPSPPLRESHPHWRLDPEQVDAVLVDLGLVLSAAPKGDGATRDTSGLPLDALCLKARRLLAFACDMGWYAVAQRMLPLAMSTCAGASAAVDAVDAVVPRDGLSLLHRSVRSGSLALVRGMLHWGTAHGYSWRADRTGPGGLTPLHLAALHEDVRIAVLLLDHCPPNAYTRLVSKDGVTPFHLAFQMGHFDLPTLMNGLHAHVRKERASRPGSDGGMVAVKREDGGEPCLLGRAASGGDVDVDPCTHCQSTLPPLMLDVEAECNDCSERMPCIVEPGAEQCSERCQNGTRPHVPAEACAHTGGSVYRVTAMCQSCHTNRSLVAA